MRRILEEDEEILMRKNGNTCSMMSHWNFLICFQYSFNKSMVFFKVSGASILSDRRETREKAMHILVVEDEQRLAHLLRRVLLEERHTVDLAYDGNAGLNLALSDTYDVVVLDVMLPGIDGLEICRQLRAERMVTPVLMLTARGSVEDLSLIH